MKALLRTLIFAGINFRKHLFSRISLLSILRAFIFANFKILVISRTYIFNKESVDFQRFNNIFAIIKNDLSELGRYKIMAVEKTVQLLSS